MIATFWEWWNTIPNHLQTPLVQAAGALGAAIIAFTGVALTLIATLAWNRKKHIEDRNLALKKDAFLSFIKAVAEQSYPWLIIAGPRPEESKTQLSSAQVAIRLIAGKASREAADNVGKMVNHITNESRDAHKELAEIYSRLKSAVGPIAEHSNSMELHERQATHLAHLNELIAHFGPLLNNAVQEFRKELGLPDDQAWFARLDKFNLETALQGPTKNAAQT